MFGNRYNFVGTRFVDKRLRLPAYLLALLLPAIDSEEQQPKRTLARLGLRKDSMFDSFHRGLTPLEREARPAPRRGISATYFKQCLEFWLLEFHWMLKIGAWMIPLLHPHARKIAPNSALS